MFTAVATSNSKKSAATINPILKSTYMTISIVAIITANSTVESPKRFEIKNPSCISTTYVSASAYNRNIILSQDGISFMASKIAESMERLDEIAALQYNWNGTGASAFSSAIIEKAKKLISDLSVQPNILPTGRDSIQMEYEKENGDYLEFELFEDGHLKLFTYTHGGEAQTKDILPSAANKVVCDFYGRYIS